ncbi:hypothetical protein Ciccas_004436 [Cichlidogyrus casuarinus]|uniref:Uncharacterized protein n=1 Tax=Cichlidogyrus casuarinus TaxID=1844966 RepID=A0ABD2QBL7_9PLAT
MEPKFELHTAYSKAIEKLICKTTEATAEEKVNEWISRFNEVVAFTGIKVAFHFAEEIEERKSYVSDKIQEIRDKLGQLDIFQVHIQWIELIFILLFSWLLGDVDIRLFKKMQEIFCNSPLASRINIDQAKYTCEPGKELGTYFKFMVENGKQITPLKLKPQEKKTLILMRTLLFGKSFFSNYVGNRDLCK